MIGQWWKARAARLRLCALFLLTMTALAGFGLFGQPTRPADSPEALSTARLDGLIVAVDAGHGGYDGGARARDSGVWEKELTLAIAQKLERELQARGARVVMTRSEDVALCETGGVSRQRKRADLQARVDIAKAAGAQAFLSVHLNEYRARGESGPQVFYQRGGDDGRLLAGVLQSALIHSLQPKRERVALAGDYYVLKSAIPSALVECGFLSNAEEEKLLLDEAYQQKIAVAIADGLAEYCELLGRLNGDATVVASPSPTAAPSSVGSSSDSADDASPLSSLEPSNASADDASPTLEPLSASPSEASTAAATLPTVDAPPTDAPPSETQTVA